MNQEIEKLEKSFNKEALSYDQETNTFHHKISEYVLFKNLENEIVKLNKPMILDAGCGTGKIAIKLLKKGFNVILLDLSSESLKIAKNKIESENITTKYYKSSCEDTAFENETFDFIMLNGAVISYTPNPEKLLIEMNRILKKDGVLWFDFFNSAGWAIEITDLEYKCDIAKSDNKLIQMPDWEYPARVMSLNYMRDLVKKNGFKIKSEYGLINLSHSLSLDIRYSNIVEEHIIKKYQQMELEFSTDKEKIGLAWSCMFCIEKDD